MASLGVSAHLHPVYEHQDHRHLPIGTKIYVDASGGEAVVHPGSRVPAAFANRPPDIIVVK